MSPENIFSVSKTLQRGEPIFVKYCGNKRKNNDINKLLNHCSYYCYFYSLLWISFAVTPVMWLAIFRHFSAFTLLYRVVNPRTDIRAENTNHQFMDNTSVTQQAALQQQNPTLRRVYVEGTKQMSPGWLGRAWVWTLVWWPRGQRECGARKCRAWNWCLEDSRAWDIIVNAWKGQQSLES